MGESFAKKERNKSKAKKKQEKAQKIMDRRHTGGKSSFEDMIAYVDEYGNITSEPVTAIKTEIKLEDIQLGAAPVVQEKEHIGTVTMYDVVKGFGFILENKTGNKLFVHKTGLLDTIKENDKVTFEREKTPKGLSAIMVRKYKQ